MSLSMLWRSITVAVLGLIALLLVSRFKPGPRSATPDHEPEAVARRPAAPPERGGPIWLEDVSARTGIRFRHTSGRDPQRSYPTANGGGVAMFDLDGDGWMDLYFVSGTTFPLDPRRRAPHGALYRSNGDGSFSAVTESSGLLYTAYGQGVTTGDLNNDGFADVYLSGYGGNRLYRNNGDGTFRDITAESGLADPRWGTSCALLDYDGDGALDIYQANYAAWSPDHNPWCGDPQRRIRIYCRPTALTAQVHILFHNNGDGTFTDATRRAGVARTDSNGRGQGVIAADLDDDGRIDLFVANDMWSNYLFLNNGDGTFRDVSEMSGIAYSGNGKAQSGMGVDIEDVNGDGRADLLLTTYFQEPATLYENLGHGQFQDVSEPSGLANGSLPAVKWAAALVDLDNDGWPDAFMTNGQVDDNLAEMGQDAPFKEPAMIWRNLGRGAFQFLTPAQAGPFFATAHDGRGAAFGDLDNDGYPDIVLNAIDETPTVLHNASAAVAEGAPNRWVRFELIGVQSNRDAIGARIEVHVGDRVIVRQRKGGGSYLSSNDPRILVGIGRADHVDRVVIRWPWPHHAVTTLTGLAPGRTYRVAEPRDEPGRPRG